MHIKKIADGHIYENLETREVDASSGTSLKIQASGTGSYKVQGKMKNGVYKVMTLSKLDGKPTGIGEDDNIYSCDVTGISTVKVSDVTGNIESIYFEIFFLNNNGGSGGAVEIDAVPTENSLNACGSGGVYNALLDKVDKITGKVLSSNDYTNEEKAKLADLEKIIIDSAMSSSSTNPVQNKVVNTALSNKVDKEAGKGLSTNDFTDADKDAISLFSGLTIDYGVAQRDCNSLHDRPIYFNKTFTTLPVVFCTYRGTGRVGSDSYCYCRISDMTLQRFCIELFAYNGNSPSSGTRYFMWFAIGT